MVDKESFRIDEITEGGPNITPRELESAHRQIMDLGDRLGYEPFKWVIMVSVVAQVQLQEHGLGIRVSPSKDD